MDELLVFHEIILEVIDSVRGEPRLPAVVATITDKSIPDSDIFVADLSTTNYMPEEPRPQFKQITGTAYRPVQNTNVFFRI